MIRLTEKKALAILLASFRKGRKYSDPIEFAESAKYLSRLYGSSEAVAERLEVGRETIRALVKVAEMPKQVKKLIADRKLLLTVAFDLIPFEPSRQRQLATQVAGLSFKDGRAVIRYSSKHPEEPIAEAKERALKELDKRELDIAVIRLPRAVHKVIVRGNPDKTMATLCRRWLHDGTPELPNSTLGSDLLRLIVRVPRRTYRELKSRTRNVANLIEKIATYYVKEAKA